MTDLKMHHVVKVVFTSVLEGLVVGSMLNIGLMLFALGAVPHGFGMPSLLVENERSPGFEVVPQWTIPSHLPTSLQGMLQSQSYPPLHAIPYYQYYVPYPVPPIPQLFPHAGKVNTEPEVKKILGTHRQSPQIPTNNIEDPTSESSEESSSEESTSRGLRHEITSSESTESGENSGDSSSAISGENSSESSSVISGENSGESSSENSEENSEESSSEISGENSGETSSESDDDSSDGSHNKDETENSSKSSSEEYESGSNENSARSISKETSEQISSSDQPSEEVKLSPPSATSMRHAPMPDPGEIPTLLAWLIDKIKMTAIGRAALSALEPEVQLLLRVFNFINRVYQVLNQLNTEPAITGEEETRIVSILTNTLVGNVRAYSDLF